MISRNKTYTLKFGCYGFDAPFKDEPFSFLQKNDTKFLGFTVETAIAGDDLSSQVVTIMINDRRAAAFASGAVVILRFGRNELERGLIVE